jgi:ATP-dependent Clp protease ATP-binding subunit ClpB
MTSNIGSQHLMDGLSGDGTVCEAARDAVMAELRARFRPEFLNRIDEIVMFKPLTFEEIVKIIGLLAQDIRRRLEDRQIKLTLTDGRCVASPRAYSTSKARGPSALHPKALETAVGRMIVAGKLAERQTLVVDAGRRG